MEWYNPITIIIYLGALMRSLICFVMLFFSFHVFAVQSFMPENDLHLEDNFMQNSNVDKYQFDQILDNLDELYTPIFKSHGSSFVIERKWEDSTVNAYAWKSSKTISNIKMFGGLARRPEVTPDGFTVVACHEIGHHLAGFPKFSNRWASIEGNSDYYATQACLKELWKNDDFTETKRDNNIANYYCDRAWQGERDRFLCYRSVKAGLSTATLLAALGREKAPRFETPDKSIVSKTKEEHPKAQCRLDTMLAGSLCNVEFDLYFIPLTRSESSDNTCMRVDGFTMQARPRCWFKP